MGMSAWQCSSGDFCRSKCVGLRHHWISGPLGLNEMRILCWCVSGSERSFRLVRKKVCHLWCDLSTRLRLLSRVLYVNNSMATSSSCMLNVAGGRKVVGI